MSENIAIGNGHLQRPEGFPPGTTVGGGGGGVAVKPVTAKEEPGVSARSLPVGAEMILGDRKWTLIDNSSEPHGAQTWRTGPEGITTTLTFTAFEINELIRRGVFFSLSRNSVRAEKEPSVNAYFLAIGTEMLLGKRRLRLVSKDDYHPDQQTWEDVSAGANGTRKIFNPSELQELIDRGVFFSLKGYPNRKGG